MYCTIYVNKLFVQNITSHHRGGLKPKKFHDNLNLDYLLYARYESLIRYKKLEIRIQQSFYNKL